jgi:hypothetical protein
MGDYRRNALFHHHIIGGGAFPGSFVHGAGRQPSGFPFVVLTCIVHTLLLSMLLYVPVGPTLCESLDCIQGINSKRATKQATVRTIN